MKRVILALLCLTLLIPLSACGEIYSGAPKTFTAKELSITLPDDFGESPAISFIGRYETDDQTAVLVIRDDEALVWETAESDDVTLTEYAELVITINKKGLAPLEKDGVVYYTYETSTDGTDFTYLATVHRSENAYWLVQFVCPTKDFDRKCDLFFEYAKTITFNEDDEDIVSR